jgi:uncharacterized protein (TIGR02594 family)
MTILQLQQKLKNSGFDPGPLDGIMGAMTRNAVRAFQAANGLEVDGIVGPITHAALFGPAIPIPQAASAIPLSMPWLLQADQYRGLQEAPGAANNPIIMDWARTLELHYSSDEVAWCGLFTAHCISHALPDEPLPNNPLGARQWMKFGKDVTPQFGSVLVFWRVHPTNSWKGHVGFYWGEDNDRYHVLGGNQSNSVCVNRIDKARLLGARWPSALNAPGIIRRASPGGVLISTNEA